MTVVHHDLRDDSATSAKVLACLAVFAVLAFVLHLMGRIPICACGHIKLWHGVVQSSENSQHLTDWYTPSHIIHGFLFYGALTWLMPQAPFMTKLLLALGVEAAWEVAENSPWIINRYRTGTAALDYFGDSILNSLSDTAAMALGFFLASRLRVAATIALALGFEVFTGFMIRDNLLLNVIMLTYPLDAIKAWQTGS
jgi:Protein of unknown function (DUF2585)